MGLVPTLPYSNCNMGMLDWFYLLTAAFLAGVLNAVTGVGSFLTLPALIFSGVPPVAAWRPMPPVPMPLLPERYLLIFLNI